MNPDRRKKLHEYISAVHERNQRRAKSKRDYRIYRKICNDLETQVIVSFERTCQRLDEAGVEYDIRKFFKFREVRCWTFPLILFDEQELFAGRVPQIRTRKKNPDFFVDKSGTR